MVLQMTEGNGPVFQFFNLLKTEKADEQTQLADIRALAETAQKMLTRMFRKIGDVNEMITPAGLLGLA
jgi:hypothetical protein